MKLVINRCFGGFGLSHAAYEKLIEYGVPVRAYIKEEYDPVKQRYIPQPLNDGEVIFDERLVERQPGDFPSLSRLTGTPYSDHWTRENRGHPLLVRLIEEMGAEASGSHAKLEIVEVPDGVEWHIDEYDGIEHIAENHRTWP